MDLGAILADIEQVTRHAIEAVDFTPRVITRPDDPVTSVDRLLDERLREALTDIVPCPYHSEESESDAMGATGLMWVVDPIDGTHNLVAGIPEYGVSVALVDIPTNTAVAAVCAIPSSGATYTAAKGHGAFLDGRRLAPVGPAAHRRVLVGFGLPAEAYAGVDEALVLVNQLMRQGFVLRQSGSAMYDVCRVASGQLLGFVEEGIKLWDFVAADLVATEAGAVSHRARCRRSYAGPAALDYAVAAAPDSLTTITGLLGAHDVRTG